MELLQIGALLLAIVSPICSGVYVVGMVRAELAGLRRDVDRHDDELRELRRVGAL